MLWPTGMVSVFTGAVDDGWGGTLGWFWAACAVTTIVLCFVTWKALEEKSYSAVMAATGLLYLAILTGFGTDLVAPRYWPAEPDDKHEPGRRGARIPRSPAVSRTAISRRLAHAGGQVIEPAVAKSGPAYFEASSIGVNGLKSPLAPDGRVEHDQAEAVVGVVLAGVDRGVHGAGSWISPKLLAAAARWRW